MEVTTTELRIQPGKILKQVVNGEEITVTFRGKPLARIVPFNNSATIFGLWKDHAGTESVEEYVRNVRIGAKRQDEDIIDLFGKMEFDAAYDYKKMRTR